VTVSSSFSMESLASLLSLSFSKPAKWIIPERLLLSLLYVYWELSLQIF